MKAPILSCDALLKSYGASPALKGVSLTLNAGETVGLLGPNGSGKTTLIKLAAGLLVPSSGKIEILGHAPSDLTASVVSYLPDRTSLPLDMTPSALVRLYQAMFADFDTERAERLLQELRVNTKKRMRALSKGTREKVQLILTMSRRARLYLLDEPIGGVDPATRDYILNIILSSRAEGSTVLIATHLIADVEAHLDSYLFLSDGEVIRSGSTSALKEAGETLDEAFRRAFAC